MGLFMKFWPSFAEIWAFKWQKTITICSFIANVGILNFMNLPTETKYKFSHFKTSCLSETIIRKHHRFPAIIFYSEYKSEKSVMLVNSWCLI